ncbi:heterokaryon incompatibility protein-domain-containing protein, partial [Podospora aff. communis PSN243]
MWLLHRSIDGDIKLVEFPQGHAPKYAILSHKWLADEDKVSFQLMGSGPPEPDDVRCNKIHFCVEQAAKDGLDYCWVDTCCIDKSSFAPIEESIRNIYYWYRDAEKCYVYLSDVSTGDADSVEEACREEWEAGFRGSTWFTRIWTLQEVLAPKEVEVFSAEGVWLGNKMTLETLLYEKMGVPRQVLRGADMATFAIEEKLSWGKDRQTGCVEDMAYGILGLFDVTAMELRYGEGSQALVRLPEEAEKREAELGVEYLDGVYL